ncbi:MAG: FtsQ-type POTRA domain-containing protein [Acidobacteriia bacterium]|nr:FtsQ-type POTRA domain-containing protein [Terriglobia bacterium]
MLAHNSVDRGIMARDSIELTQYDDLVSTPRGRTGRSISGPKARVSTDDFGDSSNSRLSADNEDRTRSRAPIRSAHPGLKSGASTVSDDSELLIYPEDLDLEDLDGEEAQFLRTNKRVPVRRSPIPKKAASQLKIAGMVIGAIILVVCVWQGIEQYGLHSWRFRINSTDAVEISGVRNASPKHVMEVAGADIGKNIFYVPLEERQKQLEQIPWVEKASVMRLLPNRIAVTIQERTPVAFAQIGPRTSLIDAGGVVMGMPANRQAKYSFPVIRGITETEPLSSRAAAMKIYNRLISELSATDGAAGPNYVRQLSEVDLSDPEDVKVTANDAGGTMVVHLGKEDFLPRYKLYVTHIADWRQQFQNVQSVDLRYEGQVIVNPDKPAEANPPRRHGDTENAGGIGTPAKPVLKPVSTKPAVKATSQKSAAKKPVHHGGTETRRKTK